jgi:hypothetical protein
VARSGPLLNPWQTMPPPHRPGRSRPNDPMMQEVRWRLFRREDMPARLRRLERLEDAAFSERRNGDRPDGDEEEPGG